MDMSLKTNFVLQRRYLMVKKERNINGVKIPSISCRAREMPMHSRKNLYQVLLLESQDVSFHEVKKAYRAKALQLHPDVSPSSIRDECTKQFVELRQAYEVLADPNSRRMYDLSLVESLRCGLGSHGYGKQKVQFRKMVWEVQLEGLKQRSADRLYRKKN